MTNHLSSRVYARATYLSEYVASTNGSVKWNNTTDSSLRSTVWDDNVGGNNQTQYSARLGSDNPKTR